MQYGSVCFPCNSVLYYAAMHSYGTLYSEVYCAAINIVKLHMPMLHDFLSCALCEFCNCLILSLSSNYLSWVEKKHHPKQNLRIGEFKLYSYTQPSYANDLNLICFVITFICIFMFALFSDILFKLHALTSSKLVSLELHSMFVQLVLTFLEK